MTSLFDTLGKPLNLAHHNSIEHSIGEELPAPTIILPSGAASLGSSAVSSREDHTHGVDMNIVSPVIGYTPATSGFTSFASFTAYYQVIGKRCFLTFRAVTPVFNGATTGIGVPPGLAPNNDLETDSQRCVIYFDATGGRRYGSLFYWGGQYLGLLVDTVVASPYPVGSLVTASIPFVWTTDDYFTFSVNYRTT